MITLQEAYDATMAAKRRAIALLGASDDAQGELQEAIADAADASAEYSEALADYRGKVAALNQLMNATAVFEADEFISESTGTAIGEDEEYLPRAE